MDNRIEALKEEFKLKLEQTAELADLDKIRVAYLGKKGSITALLKGMKELSADERKTFGADVNKLKAFAAEKIEQKINELREKEIEMEIAAMPKFDISTPVDLERGSYHPITLVQRQCETIFKSMGLPSRTTPRLLPTMSVLSRLTSPNTTLQEICKTPTTLKTVSF